MADFKRRRPSTVETKVQGGIPGFKIFKAGVRASICFPDFKTHAIPSVGHIVPTIVSSDATGRKIKKQFMAYRDDHGVAGLTPWYFLADVARSVGIGDDQRTFIAADAADEEGGGVLTSPYGILYSRIKKAVKAASGPGKDMRVDCEIKKVNPKLWFDLFASNDTGFKDVALIDPKKMRTGFVPWLSLYEGGRLRLEEGYLRGAGGRDQAQILMLSGSAMQALIEAACLETPGVDPNDAFNDTYVHGDFTALDGTGKFVVIYNADKHKTVGEILCRKVTQKIEMDADDSEEEYDPEAEGGGGKQKGERSTFGNYSVDFSSKVRLCAPGDETRDVTYSQAKLIAKEGLSDSVLENYDEIWSYFRLMSAPEQMIELASAFKKKPEVMYYAFKPTPELMTAEVRGILQASAQVAMPSGNGYSDDDDSDESSAAHSDSPYDDDDVEEYDVSDEPPAKEKGAYVSDSAKAKLAALTSGKSAVTKPQELHELEDGMNSLLTRTSKVETPVKKKVVTGGVSAVFATRKVIKKVVKKVVKKATPQPQADPPAKKKRPTDGLPS